MDLVTISLGTMAVQAQSEDDNVNSGNMKIEDAQALITKLNNV